MDPPGLVPGWVGEEEFPSPGLKRNLVPAQLITEWVFFFIGNLFRFNKRQAEPEDVVFFENFNMTVSVILIRRLFNSTNCKLYLKPLDKTSYLSHFSSPQKPLDAFPSIPTQKAIVDLHHRFQGFLAMPVDDVARVHPLAHLWNQKLTKSFSSCYCDS